MVYSKQQILDKLDRLPEIKLFHELPSKARNREYFKIIENPISYSKIKEKDYAKKDELLTDLQLLISNTKLFYSQDDQEYQNILAVETFVEKYFPSKKDIPNWITAVEKNEIATVKKGLKKSNIDAMYEDHIGIKTTWSPLHCAAVSGHTEIVKLLLESGADIEKKDSKYQGTALLWAAYAKQSAVCRILIDGGAERDVVNVEGQSPLDLLGDDAESAEWQRLFKQTRRKRGRVSDVVTNPNPKKLKITAVSPSTSADLTPSSAEDKSLFTSVGIVSNNSLFKKILDKKGFTHHAMNVTFEVKSLNLRILLNQNNETTPQVIMNHNNRPTPVAANPNSYTLDFMVLLSVGLNVFEILVYELDSIASVREPETLVIFVNRT